MSDFGELVKYGEWGEKLVDDWMKSKKNIVVYGPITEGSHPVDRIAYNKNTHEWFYFDVKTKKSNDKFNNQGIDLIDYEKYKNMDHKVILFFVDERLQKCYGGVLNKIDANKSVFMAEKEKVIFFPIEDMEMFFEL
jgi:hypothetical protein